MFIPLVTMCYCQAMYSMPGVAGEMVAYVVPAYLLAGIHYPDSQHLHIFYTYIGNTQSYHRTYISCLPGLMLLYLLCVCMLATSLAYSLSSRHLSAGILGCVVVCQALVSGYLIHADDLPVWVSWLRYVSPQYWRRTKILFCRGIPVKTYHGNNMII